MRRLAIVVVAGFAAFALVTYWALESNGVAIAETVQPNGATRSTHVWFVGESRRLWLEAGTPDNGWYRDVLSTPRMTLSIDGSKQTFIAQPVRESGSHAFIRSLIRKKYGFRDRFVGLLVDTSESVAVQLVPIDGSEPPTQ